VLGAAAPFTRWDSDPELLTLEGSAELRDYRRHLQKFGSDELIVIAFSLPNLLEADGLTTIRDLSNAFWDIEGVESVSSLDSLYAVDIGPFGPFASPLIPDAIETAPTAETLHEKIQALPMARETLLDFLGKTTAIVVQPKGSELGQEARAQIPEPGDRFKGQAPAFAVGARQSAEFFGRPDRPVRDVIFRHGYVHKKYRTVKNSIATGQNQEKHTVRA